jgi:hypothetical protein
MSDRGLPRGAARRLVIGLFAGFLPAALAAAPPTAGAAEPQAPGAVEFNRDVRPILSDACFHCHGPDRAKRKASLRLDLEEGATADLGGYRAIVPGKLDESELYRRITSDDPTEHMPPPDSGRALNPRQVAVLKAWIEQGAKWQKHWSLIAPRRPELPRVSRPEWVRNPIDRFILARLDAEALAPAPEADRTTLIRRASLDLTGLPPTPTEVDAFLADPAPDAYERVVDRLLASARYGERMAIRWLNAARYADTNGYQTDAERFMWRWRDWVIDAFNRNMPFDRFTIEQLAGDLLPNPTLEQQIATGFNRNHRGNAEGGIIPEEYAVEYVVDRVDTTATVWLGLTMLCSRCHDHKYDPITQKEFYQVFAFFNNVPENGRAIKYGNSPPVIKAPTPQQQAALRKLEAKLEEAEAKEKSLAPTLTKAQTAWECALTGGAPLSWSITDGLAARFDLDGSLACSASEACSRVCEGEPEFAQGAVGKAAVFDGARYVEADDVGDFGFYSKFSLAAWVQPDDKGGTIVSRMTDAEQAEGYSVVLRGGRVEVNLVKRWLDDAIRIRTRRALPARQWHHVLVTYDGSRVAEGIKVYIDGKDEPIEVLLDELNQSFQSKQPFRIGAGGGPAGRFRGRIDDVRVFDRALSGVEAEIVALADRIDQIAAIPPAERTSAQANKLRAGFLAGPAPAPLRAAHDRVVALRAERARLVESFPTTMVMKERPDRRPTFVLKRGEYDKPGEEVAPGVPAALPPLPEGVRRDRLALARWLVDPSNPLTARVAVNRYWQMYFGTGLVATVDDLGSQGEWPSHPALLDWLATEFVRTGWDVKALQRLIVTSATYRQSSDASAAMLRRDPDNRLLARGPRLRLPAEMIRDQALAVGGLLVERTGGPSVRPYQPDGLWKELTADDYVQDHGANLYRRSLYTFWKRTVSPPVMIAFDASTRETCTVRESRTNTPLQALALLNEVTFVEAARGLAQRMFREGGSTPEDRITLAFRLATARRPSDRELAILKDDLQAQLEHFKHDPAAARGLLAVGESAADPRIEPVELAAYTAVASLVLNLNETITKE